MKQKSGSSVEEHRPYKAGVESSILSPTTNLSCENCLSNHDGSYSKRFCNKKCARSFATKFDKKKTKVLRCNICENKVIVGKRSSRIVYCKSCLENRAKKYKIQCYNCKKIFKSYNQERKYCSSKCFSSCNDQKENFRKLAIKYNLGGHTSKNNFYYKTINNTFVYLQSNYEIIVAKELDKHNIKWTRPKPLLWEDKSGKIHRYYPDFFLPEYNIFLDPKNSYLRKVHKEKIQNVQKQNNVKILILDSKSLTWNKIKLLI